MHILPFLRHINVVKNVISLATPITVYKIVPWLYINKSQLQFAAIIDSNLTGIPHRRMDPTTSSPLASLR